MKTTNVQSRKGILFDSVRCIGCGACYGACKERNQLPVTSEDFRKDELSDKTFTVVKNRGGRFVRQMCMHCEVPTCASVCPVAALQKTQDGPVVYHSERCIGCRYCVQACPFNIPKYEWSKRAPLVKKCDLCAERLSSGMPTACAEVCPTGATVFGERSELIKQANARIRDNPGKYIDHIYGLEEVGGTDVLILSDVSFESLGYRTNLSKEPLPLLTWNVLQKIPNFVSVGFVLLGGIWWITNRRDEVRLAEGHKN